jgi:type II secretory pathway pseudopilin PulG
MQNAELNSIPHSAFRVPHFPDPSPLAPRPFRSAYTLIEMLTTVAVLIIVLGLMISLARHVRSRASNDLTREILLKLDVLMQQYWQRNASHLPEVRPLVPAEGTFDEASIRRSAPGNNVDFLQALRRQENLAAEAFSDLPETIYNEASLHDAWGSPITFMAKGQREIGTAPQDRFFFFSAGPDRRYLTREDNLYSYETGHRETSNE